MIPFILHLSKPYSSELCNDSFNIISETKTSVISSVRVPRACYYKTGGVSLGKLLYLIPEMKPAESRLSYWLCHVLHFEVIMLVMCYFSIRLIDLL